MSAAELAIVLVGGFFGGAINTLAGNGSTITLTILTEILGLPPNIANGTNRVGVLLQTAVSSAEFKRQGKLKLERSRLYIALTIVGAIVGVWVATIISNEQFHAVYRYLLLLMLPLILLNPSRWLSKSDNIRTLPYALSIPIFLIMGFYGGFIQMGMGLFFLAAMVLMARFDIIQANAVKVFVIALYTVVVLAVFQWRGWVDWRIGMLMASGQVVGGWLCTHWASKYPQAQIWAYRLLVVVIIGGIVLAFRSPLKAFLTGLM